MPYDIGERRLRCDRDHDSQSANDSHGLSSSILADKPRSHRSTAAGVVPGRAVNSPTRPVTAATSPRDIVFLNRAISLRIPAARASYRLYRPQRDGALDVAAEPSA